MRNIRSSLGSGALMLVFGLSCGSILSSAHGCNPAGSSSGDQSIVISERFGSVENGTAFDKATVDLGKYKKVIVPDNAKVRRGQGTKIQIFMRKTLSFFGHPPEAMSIRTARKNMGCAVKAGADALVITTFGEWDSHIEGGAKMLLVAVVPEEIEVEQKPRVSDPKNAERELQGEYLTKPKDLKEGYWYGPASPADGWTVIPDVPDSDRQAGGV